MNSSDVSIFWHLATDAVVLAAWTLAFGLAFSVGKLLVALFVAWEGTPPWTRSFFS